ncbi:hypothetical protein [Sedimenticola selenatireducens]|jgi:hypothetical protein|uniref:Uncharacterized protein n=1 Tax=Sedimenticola selenatireducens TaxID=191960 RepID=A0A558DQC8_9GAMM|nr:hypothetical protein [Sedimenticola selenatireducens]TVO73028.1 hypothetical protein FHP88_12340 [Sedimenticola selenatireducens]TVT63212.1 MAG: hypothetical protein FHK78_12255 [Sedimenticola selenatireducens]
MFLTHTKDEVPIHPGICSDGWHAWDCIINDLNRFWLHVATVLTNKNGDVQLRMFMIGGMEELNGLASNPHLTIKEVGLVTPDHMNGSGYWAMETVNEIAQSVHLETGMEYVVFKMKNGNSYRYPPTTTENGEYRESVLFKF